MTRIIALCVCVLVVGGGTAATWIATTWWSPCHPVCPPCSATPDGTHYFSSPGADSKIVVARPAIAVDAKNRVLVAWTTETETERTIFLAHSSDGGVSFEAPAAFRKMPVLRYTAKSKGKEVVRTSHVAPRLAVHGETFVLGWTEPTAKDKVEFLVARSTDGGKTFAETVPAQGVDASRPGYTSLTAGPDGTLAAVWLERRGNGQQPCCSLAPSCCKEFEQDRLVYSGSGGRGVCPCCDMDVVLGGDGSQFVAFRNNDKDIRDIFVARAKAGGKGFEEAVPVCNHAWQLEGCPHDGPSLAVSGGRLHVVWMDAHSGSERVYVANSALDALKFSSAALDAKATGTQTHPRLAAGQGSLFAVWESRAEKLGDKQHSGHHHGPATGIDCAVMLATWEDDASGPASAKAIESKPGVSQVHPAIALSQTGEPIVAWCEITDSGTTVAVQRMNAP
jgi:hypothetical protein